MARLLVEDLRSIGSVSAQQNLSGYAVYEDGVSFGLIDHDGIVYLRTCTRSALRFQALGSTKHPHLNYWSLPDRAKADVSLLRELAIEAAEISHIAASFGIDEIDVRDVSAPRTAAGRFMHLALTMLSA